MKPTEKQEKPTNCATKATNVLDQFFLPGKRESTECFGAFATTLLHNVYQSKVLLRLLPFGHNLKGEFWGSIFGVVEAGGELWGQELRQSKAHPRLPNISQYKVMLDLLHFWPEFQCQIIFPPAI